MLVGFAVLLVVIQGVFSWNLARNLVVDVEYLGNQRLPLAMALSDMRAATNSAPRYMWLALAYDNSPSERKKFLDKAAESMETLIKSTEEYGSYQITDEARTLLGSIKEPELKLREELQKAGAILLDGTRDKEGKAYLVNNMPPFAVKITNVISELSALNSKKNKSVVAEAQLNAQRSLNVMIILSLVSLFVFASFGYIFSKNLVTRLLGITNSVGEASSQVAAASTQLSNASESLSAASQEQASSVQETSSSLTEIAGMVELNVKVAESANHVAQDVFEISESTQNSMEHLSQAMNLILESNNRIEALVKVIEEIGEKTEVIDDIVFKTQLLSFNASVEAERAGEHGRGFAVVAQEVGNLAQMSGKAASEISSIVKTSIKEAESVAKDNKVRVEKGSTLADETKKKMAQSISQIKQILEGTQKIVSASKEQSQGVSQISTSVDALNQTIQDTASTAQESASASQELASQADSLMGLVDELRFLVAGSRQESLENPSPMESMTQAKVISIEKAQKKTPLVRSAPNQGPSVKTGTSNDPWETL